MAHWVSSFMLSAVFFVFLSVTLCDFSVAHLQSYGQEDSFMRGAVDRKTYYTVINDNRNLTRPLTPLRTHHGTVGYTRFYRVNNGNQRPVVHTKRMQWPLWIHHGVAGDKFFGVNSSVQNTVVHTKSLKPLWLHHGLCPNPFAMFRGSGRPCRHHMDCGFHERCCPMVPMPGRSTTCLCVQPVRHPCPTRGPRTATPPTSITTAEPPPTTTTTEPTTTAELPIPSPRIIY